MNEIETSTLSFCISIPKQPAKATAISKGNLFPNIPPSCFAFQSKLKKQIQPSEYYDLIINTYYETTISKMRVLTMESTSKDANSKPGNENVTLLSLPFNHDSTTMDIWEYILSKPKKSTPELFFIQHFLTTFGKLVETWYTKRLMTDPTETLKRMSSYIQLEELPKNTVLFRYGDIGDNFYLVFSGSVAVIINKQSDVPIEMTYKEYLKYWNKLWALHEYGLILLWIERNIKVFNSLYIWKFRNLVENYYSASKGNKTGTAFSWNVEEFSQKNKQFRKWNANCRKYKNDCWTVEEYCDAVLPDKMERKKEKNNLIFEESSDDCIDGDEHLEASVKQEGSYQEESNRDDNRDEEEEFYDDEEEDKTQRKGMAFDKSKEKEKNNRNVKKYNVTIFKCFQVATIKSSHTFGDIALAEGNQKRTATIICWENTRWGYWENSTYRKCIKAAQEALRKKDVVCLKVLPLFKGISVDNFNEKYFNFFSLRDYKIGDILFSQGSERKFIYFLKEGEIELNTVLTVNDISNISISFMEQSDAKKETKKRGSVLKKKEDTFKKMFFNNKNYLKLITFTTNDVLGWDDILFNGKYFVTAKCISQKASWYTIELQLFLSILEDQKVSKSYQMYNQFKMGMMWKRLSHIRDTWTFAADNKQAKEEMGNNIPGSNCNLLLQRGKLWKRIEIGMSGGNNRHRNPKTHRKSITDNLVQNNTIATSQTKQQNLNIKYPKINSRYNNNNISRNNSNNIGRFKDHISLYKVSNKGVVHLKSYSNREDANPSNVHTINFKTISASNEIPSTSNHVNLLTQQNKEMSFRDSTGSSLCIKNWHRIKKDAFKDINQVLRSIKEQNLHSENIFSHVWNKWNVEYIHEIIKPTCLEDDFSKVTKESQFKQNELDFLVFDKVVESKSPRAGESFMKGKKLLKKKERKRKKNREFKSLRR